MTRVDLAGSHNGGKMLLSISVHIHWGKNATLPPSLKKEIDLNLELTVKKNDKLNS